MFPVLSKFNAPTGLKNQIVRLQVTRPHLLPLPFKGYFCPRPLTALEHPEVQAVFCINEPAAHRRGRGGGGAAPGAVA